MDVKSMLQRLTDNLAKSPSSKIGKMFLLISNQFTELKETFEKIERWRDVDQAEGTTLDLLGENFGIKRGNLEDPLFRPLIKTKAEINRSHGSIDSVIDVAAVVFNLPVEVIRLQEIFPAGMEIHLPIESLENALYSHSLLNSILNKAKAGGVSLNVVFEIRQDVITVSASTRTFEVDYLVCGTFYPEDDLEGRIFKEAMVVEEAARTHTVDYPLTNTFYSVPE